MHEQTDMKGSRHKHFKWNDGHGVLFVALAIGMSFFCFSVRAASLPIEEEYTVRRWGVEDGLPEGTVTSVEQCPDGFLWLTTPRHVVRFDGVAFVAIPLQNFSANKPKRLNSMMRDRRGQVWVSGEDGVMLYDGQAWSEVPLQGEVTLPRETALAVDTPDGSLELPPRLVIFWVREGLHGTVWAASNAGMYRYDGHVFKLVSPEGSAVAGMYSSAAMEEVCKQDARVKVSAVSGVANEDERIWLVSKDGLLAFDGRSYTRHAFPAEKERGRIFQVFAGCGDALWGKRVDGKLFRRLQGEWHDVPPPGLRMEALLEKPDGEVWLGAVEGLYRLKQGAWHMLIGTAANRAQDVRCLSMTTGGAIWVGTGNGLYRLGPRAIRMVAVGEQAVRGAVNAILPAADGSFMLGVVGRGVCAGSAGAARPMFGEHPVLKSADVSALLFARDGVLWVGTRGGHVWRGSKEGDTHQSRSRENHASRDVTSLLETEGGHVWIGTREGVLAPDDKGWLVAVPGGPDDSALALLGDGEGGVWVGTQSRGLWHRSAAGAWRTFGLESGLPSQTIRVLTREAEGRLWIATPKGLALLEDRGEKAEDGKRLTERPPRIFSIMRRQGLPADDILQMLDDGKGSLWLGTLHALMRVSKTELTEVAAGRKAVLAPCSFGAGDGLVGELSGGDHSGPLAVSTVDGKLWFASKEGIAMLDTLQLGGASEAVPVYIEGLVVGDRDFFTCASSKGSALGTALLSRKGEGVLCAGQASSPVILPAGSCDIAVRFTAPCFSNPEQVFFRTRIEGYDNEWSKPATEREVTYARLPPGSYRFRVMASSPSGEWHEAAHPVGFVVRPFFWQTGWFRVAVGLFALGVTGLSSAALVRRRARKKLEAQRVAALEREKALERDRALEQERARIAKDIHDDIGASLTRILLQSKAARSEMSSQPARLPERLEAIENTAVDMTRVMDEIVWAVNPRNDTFDGLVTYLGRYAEEFLKLAGLRCRLDLPLDVPVWPVAAKVRHGLFLAFKEALNNAAKHSAASVVRISIRTESDGFEMLIEDDGKGFKTEQGERAGRNGLDNMRSRLAEIGGSCVIESEIGKGTWVRFRMTERVL